MNFSILRTFLFIIIFQIPSLSRGEIPHAPPPLPVEPGEGGVTGTFNPFSQHQFGFNTRPRDMDAFNVLGKELLFAVSKADPSRRVDSCCVCMVPSDSFEQVAHCRERFDLAGKSCELAIITARNAKGIKKLAEFWKKNVHKDSCQKELRTYIQGHSSECTAVDEGERWLTAVLENSSKIPQTTHLWITGCQGSKDPTKRCEELKAYREKKQMPRLVVHGNQAYDPFVAGRDYTMTDIEIKKEACTIHYRTCHDTIGSGAICQMGKANGRSYHEGMSWLCMDPNAMEVRRQYCCYRGDEERDSGFLRGAEWYWSDPVDKDAGPPAKCTDVPKNKAPQAEPSDLFAPPA